MEDLIDDQKEKIRYRKVSVRLFELFKPHKTGFLLAVVFLVISTLSKLAGPVIIRHAIDVDLAGKNYRTLLMTLGIFAANSGLYLVFNYRLIVKLEILAQNILVELKKRLVNHLLSIHLAFFDKMPVGKLTARIQWDTDALHQLFTETAVIILRDILLFFGTIAVMAYFNLRLTLITLSILPVVIIITVVFVKKSSPLFISVRKITAELSGFLTEQLQGMAVIQAFNRQDATSRALNSINERKFNTQFAAEFMVILFFLSSLFMEPIAVSLILGFGGKLAMEQVLTVGILIMFVLYVEELFFPILMLSEHLSTIQRSFAAGQRIFGILDTKPQINDPPGPHYISHIKHGIRFKNISMQYDTDAPEVLKNISFRVPKGSRCAIVGETGGGKTTIVNLLFKFYPVKKGDILFDDVSINQMSQGTVRSFMSLVQQDTYMFPGTVMDNLKLMDDSVPDSKVTDAISSLGLEDFFKKHSLKKEIIEKGANLSGGEKQVISLVRAMVIDPPVLVLDEATSSMDPYTERMIGKATDRLLGDRTSIVIAHRLSTVKNADQILVVSHGEIKESGTHSSLLKAGGIYSRFFRLQFGEN